MRRPEPRFQSSVPKKPVEPRRFSDQSHSDDRMVDVASLKAALNHAREGNTVPQYDEPRRLSYEEEGMQHQAELPQRISEVLDVSGAEGVSDVIEALRAFGDTPLRTDSQTIITGNEQARRIIEAIEELVKTFGTEIPNLSALAIDGLLASGNITRSGGLREAVVRCIQQTPSVKNLLAEIARL